MLGLSKPEIYYFASPAQALEQFNLDLWGSKTVDIDARLVKNIKKQVSNQILWQLQNKLYSSLHEELWNLIGARIYSTLNAQSDLMHTLNKEESDYFNPARDCLPTEYLIAQASMFDFCYSVLNCVSEETLWQAYQDLAQNCGWLWAYEKVCIVCERPYIISIDNEKRLHGEGEAALQLRDGFSVYSYHGVEIPEKYGRVHPDKWAPQWLLKEENAELRRVLIQGIGYARICQELKAKQVDAWEEYKLLKINEELDIEEISLLTMTCPSTGHLHALRVPPDILTAREAIRWVNWGIDPSEFTIQT
jgi:hypothetical protein